MKIEEVAAAAIKLRDTGEQDWNAYIRLEVENACESCVANLAAIRAIVEKAPPLTFDLSKTLTTLIADKAILELKVSGDIVKVRTADGWQVGVTKASADAKAEAVK